MQAAEPILASCQAGGISTTRQTVYAHNSIHACQLLRYDLVVICDSSATRKPNGGSFAGNCLGLERAHMLSTGQINGPCAPFRVQGSSY